VPQKARDVKQVLQAKGFQEEKRDHWYYVFIYNNKLSHIKTKISHGEVDISDPNCSNMAKQIKLSNPQFRDFVDCRLTKDKYLAHLIEAKHITPEPIPEKPK
jgi:hypothetical protein